MWGLWGEERRKLVSAHFVRSLLHFFTSSSSDSLSFGMMCLWHIFAHIYIWANLAWSHHFKMQNASSWKSQCKLHRVFVILEAVSPFGEPAVHQTSHPFADQLFIPRQSWVVVNAMFVCHISPNKYKSRVLFGSKSCRRISPWVLLQQRFYE